LQKFASLAVRQLKKRHLAVGASIPIALLLCFGFFWLRVPAEPISQGRPLNAWIDDLTRGSSKEVREPAEDAIRSIGPAAVPTLLRMLRTRETVVDRVSARLNRIQRFIHFPVQNAGDRHRDAWMVFMALGEKGESAIPELIRMLTSDSTVEYVPDALAAISPKCVPTLLEALPRMAAGRRCNALGAALRWPSQEPAIAPELRKLLSHQNQQIQICAAYFLARCRADLDRNVQALVTVLDDPVVRTAAVNALAEFGTNATAALPTLRKLYQEGESVHSAAISNALFQIEGATKPDP
jgi:hypothetical protein